MCNVSSPGCNKRHTHYVLYHCPSVDAIASSLLCLPILVCDVLTVREGFQLLLQYNVA